MPRTTINIDASVLRKIKSLAEARSASLTQVVSELLAAALARLDDPGRSLRKFAWRTAPMRARVDLEDKEAVHAALDRR